MKLTACNNFHTHALFITTNSSEAVDPNTLLLLLLLMDFTRLNT
jgi:hypothetical protein